MSESAGENVLCNTALLDRYDLRNRDNNLQ
jgi:hypothetical protein